MPDATPAPDVIRLRIPSRLELLSLLDRVSTLLCERAGFGEDACTQVTLSVIEAGTNAIQHGSGRDPAKPVDVTFTVHSDQLEVVVHDGGPGFDLEAVSGDITSPERLLSARGRGIFIMRACMDTVDFAFDASGTTCRLVKRRPSGAEARVVRVLAVDWGERRIGLAVSDPREVIASGLDTLLVRSAAQGVQGVVRVARELEADCVVVGMPLRMDGARGTAAEAAQQFADLVREQSGLPVETYDERLTSALSARRLHEVGVRTGHAKARVDQGAAVALLESFLTYRRARGEQP